MGARLPAHRASARRRVLHPAQPPPSAGTSLALGRARDEVVGQSQAAPPSPAGDGPSLSCCVFVRCRAPSAGMGEVARNKGWRKVVFSSHQLPLAAGKKGALCLETAATPTKPRTGLCAAEPHVTARSGLAQNGPCSPLPVLPSPSRLYAGSASWLSKGLSVWPGMGMKSQPGNAPLCAAPRSPPRGQSTAAVAGGAARPCLRCSHPNTRRARSQLGLTRIGGSGARLGVVPRKRSRGCGRAHAHPFTGITPLLYQGVPVLGWFLPAESVPGIPGLCPEAP